MTQEIGDEMFNEDRSEQRVRLLHTCHYLKGGITNSLNTNISMVHAKYKEPSESLFAPFLQDHSVDTYSLKTRS